ncbi:protein-tyrosine phosphatase-like protein [Cladochytrium replicatum]|nr:protein-tyrosine phosphatase-like protein [Cladochytrium replicatum]
MSAFGETASVACSSVKTKRAVPGLRIATNKPPPLRNIRTSPSAPFSAAIPQGDLASNSVSRVHQSFTLVSIAHSPSAGNFSNDLPAVSPQPAAPSRPAVLRRLSIRAPKTAMDADIAGAPGEDRYYSDGPARILPQLYLGSSWNVANAPLLQSLNVQYVLNVAKEIDNPHSTTSVHLSRPTYRSWENQHSDVPMSPISPTTPANSQRDIPVYRKLSWSHDPNLLADLDAAFAYIDSARCSPSAPCVLVACQQGISRSASLVIAYVMRTCNLSLAQAYAFVKGRAPNISPNMSLIGQLAEFEQILRERKRDSQGLRESLPSVFPNDVEMNDVSPDSELMVSRAEQGGFPTPTSDQEELFVTPMTSMGSAVVWA